MTTLQKQWNSTLSENGVPALTSRDYGTTSPDPWWAQGRKSVDGAELVRIRPVGITDLPRCVPLWSLDDDCVRELILTSWPRWRTHAAQRRAAARWAAVITLYWRLGWTAPDVADSLRSTTGSVKFLITYLKKAGDRMFGGCDDTK